MFINESEERLEEVARSFRTAVLSRDSTPRRAGGGKKNGKQRYPVSKKGRGTLVLFKIRRHEINKRMKGLEAENRIDITQRLSAGRLNDCQRLLLRTDCT